MSRAGREPVRGLRSSLPSKREIRILFVTAENVLIPLYAFVKQTQRTPVTELKLARDRWKDLSS